MKRRKLCHYALMGIALACIVAGYAMLLPEKGAAADSSIFAPQRIRWAPIPLFIGYAMVVPIILFPKK